MHRITGAAIILVALSGCEIIVGIEDTTEGPDTPDARSIDGPITPDARPGPDGLSPDAALADTDMDGVLDRDDNCPNVANTGQYDEDADGVGDVCDNCPSMANPDQEDVLEELGGNMPDGVGDVCDPHPGLIGDTILLFEGFNTPLSPVWTLLTGSPFVVQNGQLRNTSANPAVNVLYWAVTQPANAVIDTEVIFDALPMDLEIHSVGSYGAINTTTQTGYGCAITVDADYVPPSRVDTIIQHMPDTWTAYFAESTQAFIAGLRYQQRFTFDGAADNVGCTVTGPPGFGTVGRLINETMYNYDSGYIGVRTVSVPASFEYITVYTVVPP